MKISALISCLLLAYSLIGQGSPDWNGTYEGEILGISSVLTAKVTGDEWYGDIDASGYALSIDAIITGDQCSGTISDPQMQTTAPIKAKHTGSQITLTIHDINPNTGIEGDVSFVFDRKGSATPSMNSKGNTDGSKLDQSLIGQWRFTESYVSGEFSFATDFFMEFHPNGVVLVTDGRTAGGGTNSSIDSGKGDVHEGTWKTEGNRLWMNDGANGWVNYARYYREGNTMMLTFNNGKSQVWEKL